jgi:hypothetical protein
MIRFVFNQDHTGVSVMVAFLTAAGSYNGIGIGRGKRGELGFGRPLISWLWKSHDA